MRRCLRFVSIISTVVLFMGVMACKSQRPLPLEKSTASLPEYTWPSDAPKQFRCFVDGKWGFKSLHLSGLLYIQPQGKDYLVVFANEMGVKFLEMYFWSDGRFETRKAIASINKPAVLDLLAKDFKLLLGLGYAQCQSFQYNQQPVNVCSMMGDELRHYWNNRYCERIELWDGKQAVVLIQQQVPESTFKFGNVNIQNVKARLNIQLNPLIAVGHE